MLRDPLTLEQARAWGSWIAISGQLNVVSEWLPELPPEKLDVIKRTMPNHQKIAHPIDLFESPIPHIWQLQDGLGERRRDIIGLFNWDAENDLQINVGMAKLGLAADQNALYIGFDFWYNNFVSPFTGQIEATLPPGSCRIIAIRRLVDYPQVVSTSRHVTQGVVDLARENWDAAMNLLSGTSQIVGGDPYEIRIFAPNRQAVSIGASGQGVSAQMEQSGAEIRVVINSLENAEVYWGIVFK